MILWNGVFVFGPAWGRGSECYALEEFLCWVESHPGLASWIQAVFSVVAIVASGLIGLIPLWIARRERAHRKMRQQQRVAILLDRLVLMFNELARTLNDPLRAEMFKHNRTVEEWRQEDLIISSTPADDSFSDDLFLLIGLRTSSAVGLQVAEFVAGADPYRVDHDKVRVVGEQIARLETLQRAKNVLRTGHFVDGKHAK